MQWTDVEALGDIFSPRIQLHGGARRVAEGHGQWTVIGSASSDGRYVLAIAAFVCGRANLTEDEAREILSC